MKAMQIDRFGGPEELQTHEVAIPEPASGQLLIRSAYAASIRRIGNPAPACCRIWRIYLFR
jgi:NADPH:quinone reductase-like Zn-dependent oxidoreductase